MRHPSAILAKAFRQNSGFTLIESVVSLTLFGLVGTMLIGAVTVGLRGADTAGYSSEALQLARSQIESIINQDYAEPINYTTISVPSGDYTINIGGSVLDPGYLEQIDVTVNYPGGSRSLSAYKLYELPPIHAATAIAIASPDCPNGETCYTYYMHNNPTPPTGDTVTQANLPMNTTASPAFLRYNYGVDSNTGNDAGISVRQGGDLSSTDLRYYRNWRSGQITPSMHITGDVTVHLWGATSFFKVDKSGEVTVYLRDYNGSSYTNIGSATILVNDWMAGFEDYVPYSLTIPNVDYVLPNHDMLDLRLVVGTGTQTAEMWFMYDFIDFEMTMYVPTTP